jgi:hypothetical protein
MTDSINKRLAEATSHQEIDAILHEGPSHERAPRTAAAEPTTVTPTDSLTKRLSEATSREQIDAILHESAAAEPAQPTTLKRTEIIGGKPVEFSANSELELERAVASAYKVAAELQQPLVPAEPTIDPAVAAAERAELDLQFKRGQITSQEYLDRSGAVKDYLEAQGIPLDDLRETVEQTSHKRFQQSWADATETFLHSEAAKGWPGGDRNKTLLGNKLNELGLVDADDKVAAMAIAYEALKADDLIEPVQPRGQDGRFRSAAPHVGDNATPSELLEAWKAAQPSAEEANKTFSTLFGKGH